MTARISRPVVAAIPIVAAALVCTVLTAGTASSAQQTLSAAAERAISHLAAFQRTTVPADEVTGETLLSGVTRRVGSPSAGKPVWASVGGDRICVQVGQEGASACNTPERLESEPLIVGSWRGPAQNVAVSTEAQRPTVEEWAGVAVDGVQSVDVTYRNGTSEAVPVLDSGFYLNTEGRAVKSFGWTTSDGSEHAYAEGG
jgi:hypothetical protein